MSDEVAKWPSAEILSRLRSEEVPCAPILSRTEVLDDEQVVLNGVVGRKAGTYPGYAYSEANKNSGLTWDEATLKDYLKNPRAKVPGTKMIFPGLPKEEDIDNVIAYLKQFGPDGKKS